MGTATQNVMGRGNVLLSTNWDGVQSVELL